MISFTDILRGNFLQEFSAISVSDMLIAIGLSFLLGIFIVFIYRVTYSGVSFSKSFAGCLIMISMITTVVILVITSNVVLSLGMVGALSIVRFRTAVKEPSDTAFLFWAITTGILCGTGYVTIAILATLLLGLLFVAIRFFAGTVKADNYMVVARYEAGSPIEGKLAAMRGYRMKSKTMAGSATELVTELHLDEGGMQALDALRSEKGVQEITVMRSVGSSVL